MRILMLTPYLPYPPSSGGQIRSYNLIKQLSKKHKITLYSLIKYDDERKYIKELEKYCVKVKVFKRAERPWTLKNILRTASSRYPFLVIRNYSSEEKEDIRKTLKEEKFDIIHAETFYVSPHIPETDIPEVLVDQAIEYQVYQHFVKNFKWPVLKPLLNIDVRKIKYWETYYWRKAAHVIAVSGRDADAMREFVPSKKVSVVPNPVSDEMIQDVKLHFNKNILFIGNYAWLQNVEAVEILARDIFPKITKKIPDVKLIIVGQNTDKLKIKPQENVQIVDLKIDDIQGVVDAYHSNGLLMAPLYGPSGARVKIISSMAARVPVVTTSIGIEGIDAKHNESVLIADTYDEQAKQAIRLLTDKNLYKKIATNARRLVEENYTYEVIAKRLDAIYEEVAKK
jgi:polysaccharide biosynthesis protein PslH